MRVRVKLDSFIWSLICEMLTASVWDSSSGGQTQPARAPLFWDESGVKLGHHRNTLSSAHV